MRLFLVFFAFAIPIWLLAEDQLPTLESISVNTPPVSPPTPPSPTTTLPVKTTPTKSIPQQPQLSTAATAATTTATTMTTPATPPSKPISAPVLATRVANLERQVQLLTKHVVLLHRQLGNSKPKDERKQAAAALPAEATATSVERQLAGKNSGNATTREPASKTEGMPATKPPAAAKNSPPEVWDPGL